MSYGFFPDIVAALRSEHSAEDHRGAGGLCRDAANEIERLQTENKTLFEEHRIAMDLLRENTATLETVAAERDKWKLAYEQSLPRNAHSCGDKLQLH